MENFSSYFLDTGISRDVVHRIRVMSLAVFKMSGRDHKKGFRHVF